MARPPAAAHRAIAARCPSITRFAVALVLIMVGLAYAMLTFPTGSAMVTGAESVGVLKVLFRAGIIGAVVGLKLIKHPEPSPADEA